jgi:UDP-2,3-diacylglucosamine pyrophosphatase LpxH
MLAKREWTERKKWRGKTLFVSDTHLGMKYCQDEALAALLQDVDYDELIVVGDGVDGWALRYRFWWPPSHDRVVTLVRRKKTRFVPGNHDEFLRAWLPFSFLGIDFVGDFLYTLADGRVALIIHGDIFDKIVSNQKWLAHLGSHGYDVLLAVNFQFNRIRRWLGLNYWSISAPIKRFFKEAAKYIGNFEAALAAEARRRGATVVICGHIHHATRKLIDGIEYYNCGDFVESLTAILELEDGELVHLKVVQDRARNWIVVPMPIEDESVNARKRSWWKRLIRHGQTATATSHQS